jgi:uncharacterized protein
MHDPDKRMLLSALSHGAILFSTTLFSICVPIVILILSEDSVVKENAKESINFHLNVWFYGFLVAVLIWLSFGMLLSIGGLWFLMHWGLTIWALVNILLIDSDKPFRYPFIFRFLSKRASFN